MPATEYVQLVIAAQANSIREEIYGGTIYGKIVEMDSTDDLIAAAYLAGMMEARRT